jgi:flagellar motility protein MotE (MotC chaperone)
MTKRLREFRLLPIALIAIGCLFVLKLIGIALDGGYTLRQRLDGGSTMVVTTVQVPPNVEIKSPALPMAITYGQPARPPRSRVEEIFNSRDITGAVAAPKSATQENPGKEASSGQQGSSTFHAPQLQKAPIDGAVISMDQPRPVSAGERAVLERLQERRQELETKARELDMREGMLKATEQKLGGAPGSANKSDDAKGGPAGQRKEDADSARFKSIVIMYETMKPKDAAKIFDRLDIKVLIEVASQINPRKMSEIMAQMNPEAAERLTVELASPSSSIDKGLNPANLPKIEGRPSGT